MPHIHLIEPIRTARLTLRLQRPEHVARIAQLLDDWDIARMTTHVPHPYDAAAASAWADALLTTDVTRSLSMLVETHAGEVVGAVGAHRASDGPPSQRLPEVGYWIARATWGRGYATEALGALCERLEPIWGARAIVAGHFTDNPASGRVLEKAGFLYTGAIMPRLSLARGEVAATRMMVRLA